MADEISCFHCGLPVPEDVDLPIRYQERVEPACCAGCQAVAQSIIDSGLGSYYEHRTAQAGKASLPPDEILAQLKLYDLPEVQADFVTVLPENCKEAVLMLSGITCAACVWLIEQRLLRTAGVLGVELNYSTARARVKWDDERVQLSELLLLIQNCGYKAEPYDAQKVEEKNNQERKKLLIRLAVAGLASMQTMMFALPTYLYDDIDPDYLTILHWGAFIMVLPVMFYAATPFYQGAWRDFKNRRSGMDTPVATAIILAFIAGLYAMFHNATQGMYFESIAMFVFFLQTGRFLEHSVRRKAGDAAERLVKLVPAFCHKLNTYPQNSETTEAAVVSLQVGDVILVRAGEVIPIDGEVLEGESEVNEAMLTGENLPQLKQAGNRVTAGTLNSSSPLIIRAEQVGGETRLAHIVRLLDRALSQKPRLAELADKYASGFISGLIILAIPTFLIWWWYADAMAALWITVALLVITCPCALSLATPTALTASTGALAREGVLIARGHALESMNSVSDVVLDKTGTLTKGKLTVAETLDLSGNPHHLAVAKLLEQYSEHPIAHAILNLTETHEKPEQLSASQRLNRVGHGVSAEITLNGETLIWSIGRPEFVAEIAGKLPEKLQQWMEKGSVIALGNQHGFQAAYLLHDELKEGVVEMLAQLKQKGLSCHILSGDRRAAVQALAEKAGIEHFAAEATPESKLNYVQQLQEKGRTVLMIGDGINDAPVLAAAAVSVAVAGSADVARDGADIVLLNDDMRILPIILQQAHKTAIIIRENLIWATVYNFLAVPLAVFGFVTPWVAALGMSLSSLLVVGNALRLRKKAN